jgi:hypothetical protein
MILVEYLRALVQHGFAIWERGEDWVARVTLVTVCVVTLLGLYGVQLFSDARLPAWAPPALAALIFLLIAPFWAWRSLALRLKALEQGHGAAQTLADVATLRTRATEMRNAGMIIRADEQQKVDAWWADAQALRAKIAETIAKISPAEAENYKTVGNLKYGVASFFTPAEERHAKWLAIITRDIDFLADFVTRRTS